VSAVSPAREVSFRVLQKVHAGGFASDLLRRECAGLEARDAALAESIVFGCLRRQSQLDFLTDHFSGRTQLKLDPEVRIALRMAIYQIRHLDRVPARAAVSESVELVKRARKNSAAGLVNAVLRRVNGEPVPWPDRPTELSVPAWMLERWDRQYGKLAAEGVARAALEEPPSWVNPETGRRQDVGAQSIVPLLEIETGMAVLDLCAAPGNKSAQAVAAGAWVVACDRSPRRLAAVGAEAARVALDATEALPFSRRFQRVLVDAPCSGTGTLAGNPEIKWRLRPEDLLGFQRRQRKMLARALACLAPGGRLVYATCSLEREENQEALEGLAAEGLAAEGLAVVETRMRLPGREPGDGFFAAVIALS
jgi:16S rRNA (cytosine967-C5)-methyltransferase